MKPRVQWLVNNLKLTGGDKEGAARDRRDRLGKTGRKFKEQEKRRFMWNYREKTKGSRGRDRGKREK